MSSRDEQWWDLQAGELVLGTLDDHELELFDSIRQRDPEFQQRVVWWQEKFAALDRNAPPVEPDAKVWREIEAQLGLSSQQFDFATLDETNISDSESILDQTIELEQVQDAFTLNENKAEDKDPVEILTPINQTKHSASSASDTAVVSVDQSNEPDAAQESTNVELESPATQPQHVNLWRDLTWLATAASIVLGIVAWNANIVNQREQPQAIVSSTSFDGISLVLNEQKQPVWVVNALSEKGLLQVSTVRGTDPGSDKSYQLWLVKSDDSGVVSMGLLPTQRGETLEINLQETQQQSSYIEAKAFAVSLEPIGGTDTEAPTGPVLFQGEFVKLQANTAL